MTPLPDELDPPLAGLPPAGEVGVVEVEPPCPGAPPAAGDEPAQGGLSHLQVPLSQRGADEGQALPQSSTLKPLVVMRAVRDSFLWTRAFVDTVVPCTIHSVCLSKSSGELAKDVAASTIVFITPSEKSHGVVGDLNSWSLPSPSRTMQSVKVPPVSIQILNIYASIFAAFAHISNNPASLSLCTTRIHGNLKLPFRNAEILKCLASKLP